MGRASDKKERPGRVQPGGKVSMRLKDEDETDKKVNSKPEAHSGS